MLTICDLKPNQKASIDKVECSDALTTRLQVLGCTNGTEITFKKRAPFGDPIVINFRGSDIAIRKEDAKNIKIQLLEDDYA
jgi:ferrous iron transport protein A